MPRWPAGCYASTRMLLQGSRGVSSVSSRGCVGGCGWVGVAMIRLAVEVEVESFMIVIVVMIGIVDLVVVGSLWL